MIEFSAGHGPDSQAIGIALEEMFLDYTILPGRSPVPVTVLGQARLPGANNILMALARKTNRFLPSAEDAAPWLSKMPPGLDEIEMRLTGQDYILGAYTIVDMIMYPLVLRQTDQSADRLSAYPNINAWIERLRIRPGVGRGMMAVAG
jgi:glutathione S-transferase